MSRTLNQLRKRTTCNPETTADYMWNALKRYRHFFRLYDYQMAYLLDVTKVTYSINAKNHYEFTMPRLKHFCRMTGMSMDFICGLSNNMTGSAKKQLICPPVPQNARWKQKAVNE